ncbi:MAG: Rrf2 family transcriptional regulator [candidate division Zixibacteria bacterium]|nr:Rrf2 family transcriptional regulator [candidate division Zixibacteria bacterium]
MQFTKAEEYGIFGVVYLADQPADRITPLSEISETQGVPEKFLAKIFQSLSRSGLVRSHRGVKGGFSLGRPADQISIREIVEEIQGPYFIAKCLHTKDICNRKDCPINLLLQKAQAALIDVFEKHTVADLLSWQKSAAANRR